MIERKNNNKTNRLCDFLDVRGDSVVVVDDDEVIKVHVHTNEPGVVLTEALTYGALLSIKIENMHEQHSETIAGAAPAAPQEPEEMKAFGVVAVCAGKGVEDIFRDLGVDRIIMGGQTMNPSTEDILEKVVETPSNTVFILPNNKNIILAAQQCAPLTDKRVIVIPTKSIPQGVSAMLSIGGSEDADEMTEIMTEAAKQVRTALITTAVRTSVYDGTKIKKGAHLALIDDSLAASGTDFSSVIGTVAEVLSSYSPEFVTIFTGEQADASEIEVVNGFISSASPAAELTVISGGQPVYRYIISAE